MIRTFNGDLSELQEVISSWLKEVNARVMGIELDEEVYLSDFQRLIDGDDSDLLVLERDKIIGFMGLTIFNSPLGRQRICNEHYWYVLPEYRGMASLRFIKAAQQWAREKGCSHLMMNASAMASDMHDKVCKLYELFGMKKFETTYIWGIK